MWNEWAMEHIIQTCVEVQILYKHHKKLCIVIKIMFTMYDTGLTETDVTFVADTTTTINYIVSFDLYFK